MSQSFGPWATNIDSTERLARIRAMRALAGVFCHRHPKFEDALRTAETDPAALEQALQLLNELPAGVCSRHTVRWQKSSAQQA